MRDCACAAARPTRRHAASAGRAGVHACAPLPVSGSSFPFPLIYFGENYNVYSPLCARIWGALAQRGIMTEPTTPSTASPTTASAPPSRSVEDFLKAVFTLQQQSERVQTNTLRDALKIAAPSVTDMAKRLVAAGLIDYQKYRGVLLTDAGREIAL